MNQRSGPALVPGPAPDPPQPASAAGWRKVLGAILGVVLLGGAAWVACTSGEALDRLRGAVLAGHGRWWILVVLAAAPAFNWVATSTLFWSLTSRHGRVPWADMHWLIGASWLMNYLPLKPGMAGRIAYHRAVHGVPVLASARVLIWATAIGLGVAGAHLGAALAIGAGGSAWAYALAAVLPAIAAGGVIVGARGAQPRVAALATAIGARHLDMVAWAVRYWAALELTGFDAAAPSAVMLACVGQLAMLVPLTGNGMGLREWMVALTVRYLLASGVSGGDHQSAVGAALAVALSVDLLNRAAELVVAIPAGLVSGGVLAARLRRSVGSSQAGAP